MVFKGIPCDLITGEERRWAVSEKEPSNHLACTVEVCSDTRECKHFKVVL
jgi:ATP-dependent RNA helicase SUPV3L1/SUV3